MRSRPRRTADPRHASVDPEFAAPDPARWRVDLALLAVLLAWASAFVGIRAVAPYLEPGPMALGRLLVALPIVATSTLLSRSHHVPNRDGRPWRAAVMIALYGILWFAGYNVALNTAGQHLDAGTMAMLVNIGPILAAVLAGVVLGEGFPRPLVTGLAVSFCGVVVIAISGGGGDIGSPRGVALGVLAAALYATGVISQKIALRDVTASRATIGGVAVGAATLLPFLPALLNDISAAPQSALVWLVYLGAVPTALGFSLWAYVLRSSAAGRTSATTLAVPALTVLLSGLILQEIPSTLAMIGGVLALTGVLLARRSRTDVTGGVSRASRKPRCRP